MHAKEWGAGTQFIYFGGDKVERKVAIYPHCCLMFADQAHDAGCEGQDGLLRLHARVNKIGQGSKSRRQNVLLRQGHIFSFISTE